MSETDKVQEGMNTILIVDDDRAIRRTLEKYLGDAGYVVVTASDGESAWERLCEGTADVCLLDLGMPGVDGMEVLRRMHQAWPLDTTPPGVIIISARDDMHTTVQAVKLGAYDYLVKPLDANRIKLTVQRALEQRRTSLTLAHMVAEEREDRGVDSIVGKSEAIREVYKRIGAVATSRATVLIRGESGTGKELVARAIHHASGASNAPFIAVNCTAFPPDLLESELFGHVRGAFTGAVADKTGRFQLAGQGTLFLDEIGELRPDLQAKLLRVLQERVFERVGDSRPIKLAARVVAATHRNLEEMMGAGSFREDLYYRLRVFEILLPSLRDRREDIPMLVDYLLARIARETHKQVRYVSSEAMDALLQYRWPGNVRELENALTRGVVLCKGDVLTADVLPIVPDDDPDDGMDVEDRKAFADETLEPLLTLREVEKRHIERVLTHTGWHKRRACAILQITRPTLDRKIRDFHLERPPADRVRAS
ncbi:MAG TPA: sigma-54 dependent transcriptional regulator [Polyangiaceae bacterium]|nr:sigma-54 dependent transcriptional regulator [Polyangiaceae bacterium]HQF25450.1 sigma-54 dependent transcriptional regulator [Polyangiaceae bacterium]